MYVFTILGYLMDDLTVNDNFSDPAYRQDNAYCFDTTNRDVIDSCVECLCDEASQEQLYSGEWGCVTLAIDRNKDNQKYEISKLIFWNKEGDNMSVSVSDKILTCLGRSALYNIYFEMCEELTLMV